MEHLQQHTSLQPNPRGLEHVVNQLEALDHRGSATRNEDAAADLLLERLRGFGLHAKKEHFSSHTSYGTRLLIHVLIGAIGLAAISLNAVVGLLVTLVVLGSFLFESLTCGQLLGRLLPQSESCNVHARIAAVGSEVRGRVILCAHVDTQRTGVIWRKRPVRLFRKTWGSLPGPLKCPMFTFTAALALQSALCAVATVNLEMVLPVCIAIALFYAALTILIGEWAIGPFVPGAIDNASGVAAALTLTEQWLNQPVSGVELVVLFSGSEEVGCLGAANWLDSQYRELSVVPTCFLNLDTLGCGSTRFLASECSLSGLTLDYPSEYLDLGQELADSVGLSGAGPHSLPTQTDGLAFLVRGIPGITITTFDDGYSVPNYHQPSDTADQLDFVVAYQATEFAWITLEALSGLIAA